MYRLAIFDMDGTLLDTLEDLAVASDYALAQKGYSGHTTEEYKEFIGHGPVHLIRMALPEQFRDDETVSQTFKIYADYYALHDKDLTKPYPGVLKVLKELKQSGVKIAVYSNKPHYNVVQLCEHFFSDLVDMAVGFKEDVPPKPDPAAGFEIIRRFGVLNKDTVYIGDSGVDMMTGNALGAYTVGVSWGFRPKDELIHTGASVVIDQVEDLVKIILDK